MQQKGGAELLRAAGQGTLWKLGEHRAERIGAASSASPRHEQRPWNLQDGNLGTMVVIYKAFLVHGRS